MCIWVRGSWLALQNILTIHAFHDYNHANGRCKWCPLTWRSTTWCSTTRHYREDLIFGFWKSYVTRHCRRCNQVDFVFCNCFKYFLIFTAKAKIVSHKCKQIQLNKHTQKKFLIFFCSFWGFLWRTSEKKINTQLLYKGGIGEALRKAVYQWVLRAPPMPPLYKSHFCVHWFGWRLSPTEKKLFSSRASKEFVQWT